VHGEEVRGQFRGNSVFKRDVRNFVRQAEEDLDTLLRKVALTLLVAIVRRSPVDTGRFRGNWAVQVDLAPVQSIANDKSGRATIAAGESELARFKVGDSIYLLNHLPYSHVIEYGEYGAGQYATSKTTRDGYSVQAPRGVVRITVQEFEQYVRNAARRR
jgi:hypothetical protein